MKIILSLSVIAVVMALAASCPENMDDFVCVPYENGNVCMRDGTFVCGNCFAEEKGCRTGVEAVLNVAEASRICANGKKQDCTGTEEKQKAKYGNLRRNSQGQWF